LELYLKRIISIIVISLLTSFGGQSLHAAETSSAGGSLFTDDNKEEEFLSPDVAFKLDLSAKDAANVTADFKIVPGYYLYKQRIKFVIKDAATGAIETIDYPAGEMKDDPNFGKQEVYHHDFTANIKLASAKNPTIQATYQGCSEKGLCYAPQIKTFTIGLVNTNTGAASSLVDNNDDETTSALKTGNLWLVIAGFFVAGLLLSFTPCVLPMIPILSSIIVGSQAKQAQPRKLHAFGLSVAYVLGMALSYTLAGVAAGLSGSLISQSLQSPWILALTALVFVALAFSMFGFYCHLRLKIKFWVLAKNSKAANGWAYLLWALFLL
jgi:thioredoxin:protein disulfide reductase